MYGCCWCALVPNECSWSWHLLQRHLKFMFDESSLIMVIEVMFDCCILVFFIFGKFQITYMKFVHDGVLLRLLFAFFACYIRYLRGIGNFADRLYDVRFVALRYRKFAMSDFCAIRYLRLTSFTQQFCSNIVVSYLKMWLSQKESQIFRISCRFI